jgi:hypothetical protein
MGQQSRTAGTGPVPAAVGSASASHPWQGGVDWPERDPGVTALALGLSA